MATSTRSSIQVAQPDVDILSTNQIERLPHQPEARLHFTPCRIAEGQTNALGMQLHLPADVPGFLLRAFDLPALEVASIAKLLAVAFDLAGVQKTAAEILAIAQQMVGQLDNAMTSTAEKLKTDLLDAWDADPELTLLELEAAFDVKIEGAHPFVRG